jgi:uncharacterized Zn finger protein
VNMYCESCGNFQDWKLVDEYTDEHSVKWEVYECQRCGDRKSFAVG